MPTAFEVELVPCKSFPIVDLDLEMKDLLDTMSVVIADRFHLCYQSLLLLVLL